MIKFRCWYCHHKYQMSEEKIGHRFKCSCDNLVRVPRRDGGNSQVKTLLDWLLRFVVLGGGGALLGFGLSLLIVAPFRGAFSSGYLAMGLTAFGFVVGALGGERGIEWIGQMIRDRER
jgi:hypothetical protein